MNDNSYFSDITDFFLKAKKAENIEVNPHSKAAIREMLSYKIEQLKRIKPQQTHESFWSKWKKTIIGVPASILAVFVIVFALQNAQINVPQDSDKSAVTNEKDLLQTVEDSAVIEDIEKPEQRTIKIEPLVIDYGDKTETTPVQTNVAPVSSQKTPDTTTTTKESVETSPEPASTPTPLPTPQPKIPTPATGGEFTYINQEPQTSGEPQSEPQSEPQTTEPTTTITAPVQEIPSEKVKKIIDNDIIIQSDDNVNYYRKPISPIKPNLDKTALEKLQITDNLSTVNVHYLNEDQAAVEVTNEKGTTRWYMLEDINGNWTVTQKFD